ncbi:type IX secretion system membrane protein PorP/SprF [Maribacter sp. ACAM166]|uniref:PorP/SprF family type IX secretion system membrane protein n=1 Tax=Maribacter sp. ACAM166 TaxID=2508996 RepID=UPI0010FEC597|nr:type IX secretion system membrane protein PorP/SprF [Maribacter sp. ACAM166]TLP80137.1 type IX secretion system membrane protein PorP/SprF [Maribacter sp. ACAM166]
MKFIYKTVLALSFLTVTGAFAQQDPNYTMYIYNMNLINPAYAGANNTTDVGINVRSQWNNIKGAPETQSFIFGTPVGKNIGLGLSIISDKTFIERQTSIVADFSYHLKLSYQHDLYFGVKAGFNSYKANTDGLVTYGVQADPNLMKLKGRFNPNFGTGVYLKHEDYFLSLSAPKILSNNRLEQEDGIARTGTDRQHIYLAGGYNFQLRNSIVFKPTVLFRYVAAAPLSVDLTGRFSFSENFELGAAYRINESISGLFIFNVTKVVQIGYAYEFANSSNVRNIANATHEIMMNLRL